MATAQVCAAPAAMAVTPESPLMTLGGALGVAISGAILTARLHGAAPIVSGGTQDLDHVAHLPAAQHAAVVAVYAHALSATFLTGAAIAGCAFLLVLFLPEPPLRSSH